MNPFLKLSKRRYSQLLQHLLSDGSCEQAAFLFAKAAAGRNNQVFSIIADYFVASDDFAGQYGDYLELTDRARVDIIKRATALQACLIEAHSHPGPWPAAFSLADRRGFTETVPQVWWRLKNRPYFALVFANDTYDGLAWLEDPNVPIALGGLIVGRTVIRPTQLSEKAIL